MTTIDLSSPPPLPSGPTGLLDALPRRAALNLAELRLVAEHAGRAPLPFDLAATPDEATLDLEGRLGQSRGSSEDRAYSAAVASLHDPADSLARRGLMVEGTVDEGLVGAVGLLATPTLALDLDVVAGSVRAKSWHRQSGDAVATLATVDGIVFELAWFATSHWPAELARVGVIPEDLPLRDSAVPPHVDLPYELVDAATEAVRGSRSDLLAVLAAQHSGAVSTADGAALADGEVAALVSALATEAQGRLRVMVADISCEATAVVGVVSWVLLADGWRSLRPHQCDGDLRIDIRRVDAGELGADLASVLAEVTA